MAFYLLNKSPIDTTFYSNPFNDKAFVKKNVTLLIHPITNYLPDKPMEPEKILLIDTEKNVLLTYTSVLEEAGYRVDIATNEHEAREKISQSTFDVIITELYLKGLDTLNIIRSIQKVQPETYIILLTATLLSPNTYEAALEAGCQDCFTKPFPIKNLLPHIRNGIKRRNLLIKLRELEKKNDMFEKSPVDQDGVHYEKGHFMKVLRDEQKRSDRYKHPLSVVLLDITPPETESAALSPAWPEKISKRLSSTVRQTDHSICLNGGYGLILPETTKAGTACLTQRIKAVLTMQSSRQGSTVHSDLFRDITFISATYPEESDKITRMITAIDTNH